MLTAAELAAMQEVEESVMPSTGYILRMTNSSDGMGGQTETWGTVGTVTCDLWPINQRGEREQVSGGQINSRGEWYITMPFDTVITAKDRVEIANKTFEVTFVPTDASWQSALRVEARLHNQEKRL